MAQFKDYLRLILTHRQLWLFIFMPLLLLPIVFIITGEIPNENDPSRPLDAQKVAQFGKGFVMFTLIISILKISILVRCSTEVVKSKIFCRLRYI